MRLRSERPLSALLSQVLVAFTVESDNEFERRMGEADYPGARLSLIVWTNVMQFVSRTCIAVRDLPGDQTKHQLGCLERWGFISLRPGGEKRPGWGSGRGIRADWIVLLTSKGAAASDIWPPLFGEIEWRWEKRFGKSEITRLRERLQGAPDVPLPILLSDLLSKFEKEFNREARLPLVFCANTLRVLGHTPIRASEIPRLTGCSPETSDIGWQIKPYVVVTADPAASRGKVVRMSPFGIAAQQTYHRLMGEIDKRWEEQFGTGLRESLEALFVPELSDGLIPPPGTVRAGDQAPALGRRDVGTAARQRMRDLVAQTEAFIRDPAGSLPHFPAWDMNRGFGP